MAKRTDGLFQYGRYARNNIYKGCIYNCKYCYEKARMVRWHGISPDDWKRMQLSIEPKPITKCYKQTNGKKCKVIYPSTHDILPKHIKHHITKIRNLVCLNKLVVVTTKPNIKCIARLCNELKDIKDSILFHFTIGSINNFTLKFWEPGAPSFEERFECLKYAYKKGYNTTLLCTPMLDSNIYMVVNKCLPFIRSSIWIGKMDEPIWRITMNGWGNDIKTIAKTNRIKQIQRPKYLLELYKQYKDNPQIKWCDSIRPALGLAK